jgi:hypothetical protein
MKTKLITLALVTLTFNYANSQGLLGKLKDATKPKEPAKVDKTPVRLPDSPENFKDEFGYSGYYYSLDTLWVVDINYYKPVKDDKGRKQYRMGQKWKFIREENGNIINKLQRYEGTEICTYDRSYSYVLDEKALEKTDLVKFSKNFYNSTLFLVKLENGVYGEAKVDAYKGVVLEYNNTYAKDSTKLAVYDKETGAAKMQQVLNQAKLKEFDKVREKWMKNETYTKMIGKIGFIDQYSKVAYNRNDITEKPDVFMSSVELGKQSIFYRAYYKTPGSVLCSGCELNTTYEIDGIKVSRVEQRKKSSKWSQNIKQKFVDDNFFTAAPTIVSFQENIADYAFLYCLYQNKDKFKEGKTFKMKVTISTNQEGVDKDVLAEGTLTLVYKDANKAGVDKMIKWIEDLLNE